MARQISLPGLLQAIFIIAVIGYLALTAFMYVYQRSLQYHPQRHDRTPEELGLSGVERITIKTEDGESIVAWYATAPLGRSTVIYFHGNAGEVWHRHERVAFFQAQRFGFLAVEYRGFGASTGSPSETGFVADAMAAYQWLIDNGVQPKDIAVIGESIGTGVAVQLAAQKDIKALALESPYASAVDVGAAVYWFLPVRWLMHDQFRSIDFIKQLKAPLLILHGEQDRIIPFAQGEKLFAAANEPKVFVRVSDAGHEISYEQPTWRRIAEFFNSQAAD
jgi:uncharacterized protein